MKIKVFLVFLVLFAKPVFSSSDSNRSVKELSNYTWFHKNDEFVALLTKVRLTSEDRQHLFDTAKGSNNNVAMNYLLQNGPLVNKVNKRTDKPIDITVFSKDDDERKDPDNLIWKSSANNKPTLRITEPKLESIPEEPKPDNQDIPKSKAPELTINPASKWTWKPILFGIGVVAILGGWMWNYFYSKNKKEDPEDE